MNNGQRWNHWFKCLAATGLIALMPAPGIAAETSSADSELQQENARAQTAVSRLAKELKTELQAAIAAGGALNAIPVCNARALPLTREISMAEGMEIGRTSMRWRNPANQPTEWQQTVFLDFERRLASGEDPAGISWSEIVTRETGDEASESAAREFRYMKAIPTAPLCLQCHGANIAPPVAEKISELYPEDHATGYAAGEIRGAFVVTRTLD